MTGWWASKRGGHRLAGPVALRGAQRRDDSDSTWASGSRGGCNDRRDAIEWGISMTEDAAVTLHDERRRVGSADDGSRQYMDDVSSDD